MTFAPPARVGLTMMTVLGLALPACDEDESESQKTKADRPAERQAPAPPANGYQRCPPVLDVFAGTNDEGDLYRIEAQGVSCPTAQKLVRKGTEAGLSVSGGGESTPHKIARHGEWLVIADVSGVEDHYEMQEAWPKRINWIYGDIR